MKDIQIDGFWVKEALGLEKMGLLLVKSYKLFQTEIYLQIA